MFVTAVKLCALMNGGQHSLFCSGGWCFFLLVSRSVGCCIVTNTAFSKEVRNVLELSITRNS